MDRSGGTWRPVPGFEDRYDVSENGQVWSHISRRVLVTNFAGPYGMVSLSTGTGKAVTRRIHVLVASAFIGPRPSGQDIRHLDGDHLNNAVANLRYGTRSENLRDCVAHGRNVRANQTHCAHGHEYVPENTFWTTRGRRECRECRATRGSARMRAAEYEANRRRRAEAKAAKSQ